MKLGRDGIAGLIGLAVSLALLPFVYGLPTLPIVPIGPGFYPVIVLVFLAIMCAALVVQDLLAQRQAAPPLAAPAEEGRGSVYRLVGSAFAVTGAYILLLPELGFRLSTVLFVAAFQLVLERPRTWLQWLTLGVIAVATSAVTYLVFDGYLSVLLPRGRWTGW